jgi:putative peptidoglycan lipid II flippase
VAATAVLAGWLGWVAWRLDWVALQAQWLTRIGLLAGALAVAALLYFGVLRLLGLDLRQFARRG